ncbi:HAD family hydrolase [Paenibacillus doosanensis]|uniref:Pyrimidine 5'-nucleotidase YjjG n=1 Tax=Paenibacillus konkukensis TaxID=2020716 RepID=A0ABY4RKM6_9BACL|nr:MULTISPECIES: HAD family hydrolase [Paenibacillus]MCS7463040.1 HAD family hydrolase [Paenibacillus doosanensis]UQZ83034.1 Pyrimidine 5'-nucleotidase YjjG [Paenibacillus konkukensis]
MSTSTRTAGKKAICFDVNQTLIHQGIHFEQAFRSVWNDYYSRSVQGSFPTAEALWSKYQFYWQQHKKNKTARLQLDDLQQQCLQSAIKELEVPVHQQFARDFFQLVRRERLAARSLAPGVEETLRSLAPRFKLAIISNSPRSEVKHLLERFGLHDFFPEDRIFTAQHSSEKKPNVPLFKTAIRTLDLSPRQLVMVGNSWKHDVCGATKAGLDAVWVQSGASAKKITQQKLGKRNVYCIQQMDQLLELF